MITVGSQNIQEKDRIRDPKDKQNNNDDSSDDSSDDDEKEEAYAGRTYTLSSDYVIKMFEIEYVNDTVKEVPETIQPMTPN